MRPNNFSKTFIAPDRESSIGAIISGSYLDKHHEEITAVLLGDAKLSDKLERALPRHLSKYARLLLREGVDKVKLGHKKLRRAAEEIGLYAEIPLDGKSGYVDNIWTKRYIRGYLKALSRKDK